MHELSIASSVVEIASRHAAGQRVSKVVLMVGYLRQVVPSALAFSFEIVARGTPVEGAELELVPVPARGLCNRCTFESELRDFPLQCGSCGGFDLTITAGEELLVESLELEEMEVGANRK